mmetsp:Transcript_17341/g.67428  ORF Transcript_17341/g.67428 Transcript_17341/m.67428 type:complete len:206 (-) Transcript_17341:733-1350(-)
MLVSLAAIELCLHPAAAELVCLKEREGNVASLRQWGFQVCVSQAACEHLLRFLAFLFVEAQWRDLVVQGLVHLVDVIVVEYTGRAFDEDEGGLEVTAEVDELGCLVPLNDARHVPWILGRLQGSLVGKELQEAFVVLLHLRLALLGGQAAGLKHALRCLHELIDHLKAQALGQGAIRRKFESRVDTGEVAEKLGLLNLGGDELCP